MDRLSRRLRRALIGAVIVIAAVGLLLAVLNGTLGGSDEIETGTTPTTTQP